MCNYFTLLVTVIHPTLEMTLSRYCIGVSLDDPRMKDFNLEYWAEPGNRYLLRLLLCEDWLTKDCEVVGCEQIAGAVQW